MKLFGKTTEPPQYREDQAKQLREDVKEHQKRVIEARNAQDNASACTDSPKLYQTELFQRIPPKLRPMTDPTSWAHFKLDSTCGQMIYTLLKICCELTDDEEIQVSAWSLWAKFIKEADAFAYG